MAKQQDMDKRQVLCVVGNRHVVFGPLPGMNQRVMFNPESDTPILPRIADDSDLSTERLIQTLQVYGMKRVELAESEQSMSDLSLVDAEGAQIFIEVKVRAHNPKSRDLNAGYEQIRLGQAEGQNVEVWHFNTERLDLVIQAFDKNLPVSCELPPSNVWEISESGIFRRDHVVAEVSAWEASVKQLYADVTSWYGDKSNVKFDSSRSVTMSEELMQKYAVSDRELPILDIIFGDQVLASLVPRGLWLIGAWGRIDVITEKETRMLVRLRTEGGTFKWHVVSLENRRVTEPLSKDLMRCVLEAI